MKFILVIVLVASSLQNLAQKKYTKDFNKIYKSISGNFNNQKQILQLPDTVNKQYTKEKPWVNLLYAIHTPLVIPLLGEKCIYVEWREASDTGKISRQRIWVFQQEGTPQISMKFYAFKHEADWKEVSKDLNRLRNIDTSQLVNYPTGCNSTCKKENNSRYSLLLNPETCSVITQRTKSPMKLYAEIVITNTGFQYQEKGILPNGNFAFVVPGISRYLFEK